MRGRSVKVNRSMTRPITFCGVEKKIALAYGVICLSLIFGTGFSLYGIMASFTLFVICHNVCLLLGKKDPQTIEIFLRAGRFSQGYFSPRGGVLINNQKLNLVYRSYAPITVYNAARADRIRESISYPSKI